MYNRVILVGNLTRDIELRYLPSGTAVGSTGIATNRRYKNATGEQRDEVMFIDLTFFGRTAEVANQYLRKGSKVLVEGRLKLDSWEDPSGMKRSRHSVVVENMQMLDSRQNSGVEQGGYSGGYSQPQNNYTPQDSYSQPTQQSNQYQNQNKNQNQDNPFSVPDIDIEDDEIPF